MYFYPLQFSSIIVTSDRKKYESKIKTHYITNLYVNRSVIILLISVINGGPEHTRDGYNNIDLFEC